ncbi:MAG: hypothetical protein AAGF23_16105 [Acidobacteriota bacterium]
MEAVIRRAVAPREAHPQLAALEHVLDQRDIVDRFLDGVVLSVAGGEGFAETLPDLAAGAAEPMAERRSQVVRPGQDSVVELPLDGLDVDSEQAQTVLDRLESLDPAAFALVAVNDPDGPDTTMLQYTALAGDINSTQAMVDDIEALWFGDSDQITVTSTSIVGLEITTAMTESQTLAIVITISAALFVLVLFFWVTEFKPMLAVIAVLPIVLVLIWVLG